MDISPCCIKLPIRRSFCTYIVGNFFSVAISKKLTKMDALALLSDEDDDDVEDEEEEATTTEPVNRQFAACP